MSTTYLDEAERATRLVVLDRGEVVVAGTPTDVVTGFRELITSAASPARRQWSWRRGRVVHELWPATGERPPAEVTQVAPDLEDVVIAMALHRRLATEQRVAT
jgi:ABC-2 type transport system ATP-binding protein